LSFAVSSNCGQESTLVTFRRCLVSSFLFSGLSLVWFHGRNWFVCDWRFDCCREGIASEPLPASFVNAQCTMVCMFSVFIYKYHGQISVKIAAPNPCRHMNMRKTNLAAVRYFRTCKFQRVCPKKHPYSAFSLQISNFPRNG